MKMRTLIASMALVFMTTNAMAEQNFVTKFLNRYRPPATAELPEAPVSVITPEQALQQMIRQGTLPLSVTDTVRLMIASNLDIKVDRYSPLAQQLLLDTLFRPFEPTLRLSGNMNRSTQPTTSTLDGATTLSRLTHNYNATFSQQLTYGTFASVNFNVSRSSSNSANNTFSPSYSQTLTYSFQQPLLRDFGRNINMRSIRVSKNNKNISDIQFEMTLVDLVSQAEMMYWDLVGSREDIRVKQAALELAQKTQKDNERQVEIGTLAPIQVVQTQANVAARQEQMVVSTFSSDQLQDRIKRLITGAGDPAMILAKLNPTETVRRPNPNDLMPIEEAIKYALESRPEMRQLLINLTNSDIDLEFAKNQLLPAFSISASYTQNGIGGNELAPILDPATGRPLLDENGRPVGNRIVRQGGLVDAFGQVFRYDFTGYAVGFNLTIPLSNKSARAEYSRVMAQKQSTEARRVALAQAVALEVRNAYSQVEMNRARITAAEKSRELAVRSLEAEQKKFELGSGEIRFVLQEQQNVTQAQTNEIQSLVNYTKSLILFDKAIGRTLQRNNVQLDRDLKVAVGGSKVANAN